jgi:hypothetical protein
MRYRSAVSVAGFTFRVDSDSIVGDISLAGETMDEEISAMRGILLGVLTGATLWLMIYAATFL